MRVHRAKPRNPRQRMHGVTHTTNIRCTTFTVLFLGLSGDSRDNLPHRLAQRYTRTRIAVWRPEQSARAPQPHSTVSDNWKRGYQGRFTDLSRPRWGVSSIYRTCHLICCVQGPMLFSLYLVVVLVVRKTSPLGRERERERERETIGRCSTG